MTIQKKEQAVVSSITAKYFQNVVDTIAKMYYNSEKHKNGGSLSQKWP